MNKNFKRFVSAVCTVAVLSLNFSAFAGWRECWDSVCETTKNAAHEAGQWTSQKAHEAGQWTSQKAHEAGQWVSNNKEEIIAAVAIVAAIAIACNGGDPESARSSSSSSSSGYSGGYSYTTSHASEGPYKYFSQSQKADILQQNRERNGGVLRSDYSGKILEEPHRYTKGYTPSPYEAQVDHIQPRSGGGWNSAENAQVLSREENLQKSDNPNW